MTDRLATRTVKRIVCQGPERHRSEFTHAEIMAVQKKRAAEHAAGVGL